MAKVFIPKSTKKIYYQIFKGVSIADLVVFLMVMGITTVVAIFLPGWILKLSSGLVGILIGLILLVKGSDEIRIYQKLSRSYYYFFKRREINDNLHFKKTEEGVYKFKVGENTSQTVYGTCFWLEINNLNLLNENEKHALVEYFGELIKTITLECKLVKIDEGYNFSKNIKFFEGLRGKQHNHILDEQIKILKYTSNDNLEIASRIYLMVFDKNFKKVQNELNNIMQNSFFSGFRVRLVGDAKMKLIINKLNLKSIHNIKVNSTGFTKNKTKGMVWTIGNLPSRMNMFWLSELCNVRNVNVIVNIKNISKTSAKKKMDSAINKIKTNANFFRDKASSIETLKQYEDSYQSVMEDVMNDVDVLKDITILLVIYGSKQKISVAKNELKRLRDIFMWKYDNLTFMQKLGLEALWFKNNDLYKKIGFEMTSHIFATGFPVSPHGINDEKGFVLGNTVEDEPVVFDAFHKNEYRVNSNMLVLGQSGSGKSFLAKKILLNTNCLNSQIFILDPEREYQNITRNLGGQWIDASGANKNKINVLQIYKNDDELESNSDAYFNQLSMLDAFFNIISRQLSRDDVLKSLMMNLVKQTYGTKNITPNSDVLKLKNEDFPIFSDVLRVAEKALEEAKKNKERDKMLYNIMTIISILEMLCEGQYSKYWNGVSSFTIDSKKKVVCFDLNTLALSGNEKIVNLQMFLLLRMIEQRLVNLRSQNKNVSKDKQKKFIIMVDEAHLLVDEKNPVALDFLFHTAKRIRKYNGSLIIITQNVADFTSAPDLAKKFTGIINNSQYWFVGGLQDNDLNALNDMYRSSGGLSDAVKNFISTAKQGRFWMKLSNQSKFAIQVQKTVVEEGLIE